MRIKISEKQENFPVNDKLLRLFFLSVLEEDSSRG